MVRAIHNRSPFALPMPSAASTRNTGARRRGAQVAPITEYRIVSDPIPLQGAQGLGFINASGKATLAVGPSGLGTVWYPASAVVSTALGNLDPSTCNVFIGPSGFPTTLQGSIFTGNGVLALAIPAMSPGLSIIAQWTGGTPGTQVSLNVTGSLVALIRAR